MGPLKKNHRGMRFTCDQSWEAMTPIVRGTTPEVPHGSDARFCDACQKPVIDFSGWSREELLAWFKEKPKTCGQFEPHQVDPSLVPLDEVGKGMRRGFFATLAALTIGQGYPQAVNEPAAMEQADTTPANAEQAYRSRTPFAATNPKLPRETCQPADAKSSRPKRNKVYASWRFPFLHIRRRHLRGKAMVRGCPSF